LYANPKWKHYPVSHDSLRTFENFPFIRYPDSFLWVFLAHPDKFWGSILVFEPFKIVHMIDVVDGSVDAHRNFCGHL